MKLRSNVLSVLKLPRFLNSKLGYRSSLNRRNIVLFVFIFAVAGATVLLITHAVTPALSVEPEINGSITAPAVSGNDSGASAGGYVQFKAASIGVNKAKPFASNSPWNTPTPSNTQWFDHPVIHTLPGGDTGHWWVSDAAFGIFYSSATDPVWTFNMPAFIAIPWHRNRPAQILQIRAPATITTGSDSDHILVVVDPVSGDYIEVWQAVIDTATHTITSNPGPGWGTGNAISGPGAGSTANNDGVRASNFAWLGGALTGYDWDSGVIDHALVWASNAGVLKQQTYSGLNNVVFPATAGEPFGGASAPIKIGTKIGIPSDAWLTANGLGPAWATAKATLSTYTFDNKQPGLMLADSLQKYGAYLGDYVGGSSQFYVDGQSKRLGPNGTTDAGSWAPLFAHWYNYFGPDKAALEVLNPFLRVADYQP